MADNAPFYVGSTEDHDILIHPDNAVSLQPKGFAEKNGITAHPDGAIALRNVAPKLYKSLGPGFQGTERDISIVQSEQPPSLSLRAGNAVRDAADAASRGLGKIVDYVRGAPQTEPAQAAQPPPPTVPQQPVKRAPQPVPPGVNPQNWDTEEGRMIGSPGATHLQMGDGTEVILPEGYEDTGRLIGQPGATHLQMGDGKEVILPAGYESTGGGGGGSGGGSGGGGGSNDAGLLVGHDDGGNEVIWTKDGPQLQQRGFAEANGLASHPDGDKFMAENDPNYKQSYRSFHGTFAGPRKVGTTASGQEVLGTPDGSVVVAPSGHAASKGISDHGNPGTFLSKNAPRVAPAVKTPPPVADSVPERNDPQWEQWYRERRAKHQQRDINKSLKAEPGVVLPDTTRPEPLDPATAGGVPVPRPVVSAGPGENDPGRRVGATDAAFGPGSQKEQPLEDVREVKPPVLTDAERNVQLDIDNRKMQAQMAAREADKGLPLTPEQPAPDTQEQPKNGAASGVVGTTGKALFNSLFPTLGALSNAVGIGKTVGGVNSGAAQAAITGATEAERVGAFASAKRLAGLDLTPDEVAKADAFEKNPVQGLREAMTNAVKDGLSVAQSKIGKPPTQSAEQAPGTTPGQKVKPVIPVGAAQVPGATPPGAVPAPGQSGASVSSARMFVPGVKGDAAPTSETKAQEVERRGKGMADREEQIAQMQSKADQDLANTKERQSQEIARLDAQEMEIRRKANEDAEKMLGDLKAKADEIYNTKTDPYRAFRHTDTGQKIALVAGAFLNGFANAVNPGRNGKDAFEQIMDNDIQAQAKDIKNKESGLNQLMDVFKKHGILTQNKILAATMLKSKYLEEAARTVEVMGLRSGDPIKVEMAKNKADSLRNQAVALGQAAQEEALKITHGNQQTQLNYQAIQKNKMDLDLQQTMLKQMQNGGGMMGMLPSRSVYGHPVAVPPAVSRDPNAMTELYEKAGKVYTAHQDIKDASDLALKLLEQNKGSLFIGPNDAEVLKEAVGRVLEAQRQSVGQNTVPTGDLKRLLEEVLGKGNNLTPGNYARLVGAWQRVSHQADVDGDSQFEYIGMPKLSVLRANRKDVQYGNTPTAAPAPGN